MRQPAALMCAASSGSPVVVTCVPGVIGIILWSVVVDWRTRMLSRLVVVAMIVSVLPNQAPTDARAIVADRVVKLTRESPWKRIAVVPIAFRTFHPQGLVKIGDTLYVSSVEVTAATTRFA